MLDMSTKITTHIKNKLHKFETKEKLLLVIKKNFTKPTKLNKNITGEGLRFFK